MESISCWRDYLPGRSLKQGVGALPGLDPAVVRSARQAGIPEAQLTKMSQLVQGARKLPAEPRKTVLDPLDDEEEEAEVGAEVVAGGGDALQAAVLQMSQILQVMHKDRRSGTLEEVLERADGPSEATSSSQVGGRSKGAAYLKLRGLLRTAPQEVWQSIERCMQEDFMLAQTGPGLGARPCTARAWVEHRSMLQPYQGPIRHAWTLAGIADALAAVLA